MEGASNRTKILTSSLAFFAARGYEGVGVQEIVDAAGVTKPTLYHYFGSKQGLLETLLREHFTELTARVRQAATYTGDLPLTLTRIVEAFFAFARLQPTFYRLQLAIWFAPPESEPFRTVAPYLEELQRIASGMFAQAVLNHGNMRGRHEQYAATFLGTINTYVGLSLNGYGELDLDLVHRVVRQFSHGIYS